MEFRLLLVAIGLLILPYLSWQQESFLTSRFVKYKSKPLIGYFSSEDLGLGIGSTKVSSVHPNIVYFLSTSRSLCKFNFVSGEIQKIVSEDILNIDNFIVVPFRPQLENGQLGESRDLIYYYAIGCVLKRLDTFDGKIVNIAGNGTCLLQEYNTQLTVNATSTSLGTFFKIASLTNVQYSNLGEIEIFFIEETSSYLIKNGLIIPYGDLKDGVIINNRYETFHVQRMMKFESGKVKYGEFIIKKFNESSLLEFYCDACSSLELASSSITHSNDSIILEETLLVAFKTNVKTILITTIYNRYNGSIISCFGGEFKLLVGGSDSGIAGDEGLAVESRIYLATSISFSHQGFVLLLDITSRLRMVNLNTGVIRIILENMKPITSITRRNSTQLRTPKDLTIVKSENGEKLIISDSGSSRMLRYSFNSEISEVIHAPLLDLYSSDFKKVPTFALPFSIVSDFESNLIVVNSDNYWTSNFIVKFNPTTLKSKPLTGSLYNTTTDVKFKALSMVLNQPQGACMTEFGTANKLTILISDTDNNRVIMVDVKTGMAQILFSKGDGLGKPTGIAVFLDSVIVADKENHCLWKFNMTTTSLTLLAGIIKVKGANDGPSFNATFNQPHGIFIANSAVVIADTANSKIRHLDLETSIVKTIAGTGEAGLDEGVVPLESKLNYPRDVISLYGTSFIIADTENNRIRSGTIDSTIQTGAGIGGVSGSSGDGGYAKQMLLFKPHSIDMSRTDLYLADTNNFRIRRLAGQTGLAETIIGGVGSDDEGVGTNTKLSYPSHVRFFKTKSGTEYLVIADTYANRVKLYNIKTKMVEIIAGGIGDGGLAINTIVKSYGVAISPNSNDMYLTDSLNNRIRRIDPNGIISTIAGKGYGFNGDSNNALNTLMSYPSGIAVTLNNEIIFSDSNNNRIRMIHTNGSISTIAGNGISGCKDGIATQAELYYPTFLKLIPPDYIDIIFTDYFNHRVRKVIRSGGTDYVYTISGNSTEKELSMDEVFAQDDYLPSPEGMAISPSSGNIYISDSKQNVIRELTPYCKDSYILNKDNTMCLSVCFGIPENVSSLVCNGNGKCVDTNQCACTGQYSGEQCQYPICFNFVNTSMSVCNYGNGSCIMPDRCICNSGYLGDRCDIPICFGKYGSSACSKNGNCIRKDECSCKDSFAGTECEINIISMGVGIGLAMALCAITIICIPVAIAFCKIKRKHKKLTDTDMVLDERLLMDYSYSETNSTSISTTVEENSDKFLIPIEQLNMDRPIKKLGEGGMGSVFSTKYNGMIIAVKVFDLNNLNISEHDFKVEALLLSKIRHPNIISFFGISSTPTKRFIAMEYMDKSLDSLIASLQRGQSVLPLDRKLKILLNIVSGIYYLHHLKPNYIVHRDLKPANILLDKSGIAKLCDFGLGRALSSNTISALTNQIGTSNYMSPELFSGDIGREDARSIDIYSLAIIIWQLIFEIIEPYQSLDPKVLEKLNLKSPKTFSSAYHFHKSVCEEGLRPVIPFSTPEECKEWCEKFLPDQLDNYDVIFEMTELIKQLWSHDPSKRSTIVQILEKIEKLDEKVNI